MAQNLALRAWQQALKSELQDWQQKLLGRKLEAHLPHLSCIDFSSNDYLSLNSSGELYKLLKECVTHWPGPYVGSTASRLIRGHYEAFTLLEEDFARRLAVPSALFFGSGYTANTGTLPAILNPRRDLVFCDRLCHASLLDGIRLSQTRRCYFRHNDLNDLESQLQKCQSKRKKDSRIWIVAESLYSMDGDSPDLQALCALAERYEACIYLDEAHALGVYGRGAGLAYEAGVLERIAVTVFPCGKAPGLIGAFVCGPKELKDVLVNRARSFVYATAPPPFLADLLQRVLSLVFSPEMEKKRENLKSLSLYVRTRLAAMGLSTGSSTSQIVPILLGSEKKALTLAKNCQRAGFDIRAIRPPSVSSSKESRLRLSLQAQHTKKCVEKLCDFLSKDTLKGSDFRTPELNF